MFWLLPQAYSYSEETSNLVTPADEWTQSGKVSTTQCSYSGTLEDGEVCTGSANTRGVADGGGTITSDVYSLITDGGLTIEEIQQGFDINYGVTVESHQSNITVPTCSATNGDCKDIFKITVTLRDQDNTVFQTLEKEVELDFSGTQDYLYTDIIQPNNYTDITTQMSLWGTDAGYTTGYYGAIFSDPVLTATYAVVQQVEEIIDDIINDVIDDIINDSTDFEIIEIDFGDNLDPLEINIEEISIELPEIEMAELELPDFEIEVEPEVEIEIAEAMEEVAEMDIEVEPEVENEPEVEETEEVEETQEPEPEQEEREVKVVQQKETKEQIAKKILAKVADSGDQVALDTVKLAVMAQLADTKGFNEYQQTTLTDMDISNYNMMQIDDLYGGLFQSAQNNMMEDMINAQY
ncbi:hypothetical protein [uncultured Mediterranean phage uvMED]|nr:hypothetical protein [uncultured Mediterranean phage uvMED]